jgi:hypothetical protein
MNKASSGGTFFLDSTKVKKSGRILFLHCKKHDPWPYIGYLLFVLKQAYREFEERVGQIEAPRGAKMEMVFAGLQTMPREFSLQQLEASCPGVGRDWIKSILNGLKQDGKVICSGRGRGARWSYLSE